MENDVQLGITVKGTIILDEAIFKALPASEKQEPPQTVDQVSFSDETENGFRLFYSREVRFDPSAYFEIKVAYHSDVVFDNDAGRNVLKTPERIRQWIVDNKKRIIETFGLPTKASFLVASLFDSAGMLPFVTPPTIIEEKRAL